MVRKTKTQHKLTVEKAWDIVIRIKQIDGLSKHTITNYHKLFNDFERCFAKNKYMENFTLEDVRRFIYHCLHRFYLVEVDILHYSSKDSRIYYLKTQIS